MYICSHGCAFRRPDYDGGNEVVEQNQDKK